MTLTRTKLKWIVAGAISMTAVWLVLSLVVALRYTRRAQSLFDEPAPTVSWGNIEAVRLPTDDGEELGAWFIDEGSAKPVVIVFHGNGGCRTCCLPISEALASEGYSALLVTMRAHGDSTGSINDFGYGSRYDVMAAIKWMEENHRGRRIVVWGQSLGAAAAMFGAGEIGTRVSGYILECPYKDIYSAVWNRLHMRLPPPLDGVAYLGLLTVSPVVLPQASRLCPLAASANIPKSVPVLILAGSNDGRAPPEDARAIAARIGDQAHLVVLNDAGHLELQTSDPQQYRSVVREFIAGCQSASP